MSDSNNTLEPDAKFQMVQNEVSGFMRDKGWTSITKSERPNGSVIFSLNLHVDKVGYKISVTIAKDPIVITICSALPCFCSPEYSLLVDEYIADYNIRVRIGALKHDSADGAVEFEYAFPVFSSFKIDDFKSYLDICIYAAADVYPNVSKLCVGRVSEAKMNAIAEKIAVLTSALIS
jgi:hypothetical protein